MPSRDDLTRERVLDMLRGNAGRRFEAAIKDFPMDRINDYPPNVDYTPWHLIEHLRISVLDIVEYTRDPKTYVLRKHPDEYWPAQDAKATPEMWEQSVEGYRAVLKEME